MQDEWVIRAAEAAAVAAAAIPRTSPAAGPAAWVADATVVIDDTQHSPLTPADAAAAAGHSDMDVSSPDGQPTSPASWAQIGAYGKSRGPPTKDPSPTNLDFMGGHLPKGPSAAGAAVETVDLLSQTPADAGGSPSPATAQAAGPGAPPAADADALAASLAAMWPDGQGTQAEMLQWAVNELATRRADAQRDKEAFHTAKQQMAAAEDQLRVAALGVRESGDIRMAQQRRIAELVITIILCLCLLVLLVYVFPLNMFIYILLLFLFITIILCLCLLVLLVYVFPLNVFIYILLLFLFITIILCLCLLL